MNVFISLLLGILCFVIICLLIILFGKTKLIINSSRKSGGKVSIDIILEIFWGLFKIDLKKKSEKEKKPDAESEENISKDERKFIDKAKHYYGIFCDFAKAYLKHRRRLRKSICLDKIKADINFGLGDAAKTGIYLGTLWASLYNAVAIVSRIVRIREPKFEINPHYNESIIEFDAKLVVSARLWRLLIACLSIGFGFWRFNRKRKKLKKEKAAM